MYPGENKDNEPIISVPSFNPRYYKIGTMLAVRSTEDLNVEVYYGIIQNVNHQEMLVLTVDARGVAVTVEIIMKDVLSKKVVLNLVR